MRTEYAARASQTRVRFLLSKDAAINPRYALTGPTRVWLVFFFLTRLFSAAPPAAHVAPPAPAQKLAPPTGPSDAEYALFCHFVAEANQPQPGPPQGQQPLSAEMRSRTGSFRNGRSKALGVSSLDIDACTQDVRVRILAVVRRVLDEVFWLCKAGRPDAAGVRELHDARVSGHGGEVERKARGLASYKQSDTQPPSSHVVHGPETAIQSSVVSQAGSPPTCSCCTSTCTPYKVLLDCHSSYACVVLESKYGARRGMLIVRDLVDSTALEISPVEL